MPRRRRSNLIKKQIRIIRRSVSTIEKAVGQLAPLLRAAERPGAGGTTGKRSLQLSPQRRATLKLQGTYMGHLRHLPQRHKARVKALKAKKGFRAAIALARRLAS